MCEHDPEHDHDHHDHHEHEHDRLDSETDGISINEHEGALVASTRIELSGGYDEAEGELVARLERFALTIEKQGGVIGHIKASLFGGGTISTLSTTGGTVNVSRGDNPTIHAEVVAIVFGISEDMLHTAFMQDCCDAEPRQHWQTNQTR